MKFLLFLFLLFPFLHLSGQSSESNSNFYAFQSTIIQGRKYSGTLNDSGFMLVRNERDTLLKTSEVYFSLKFKDFDKDGFEDLFLDKGGNIPERYDLYFYSSAEKKFKQISGFDKFPDPTNIAGTKYFYSYHRNGCADQDWLSDLFYLDNFKIIRIGKIDGVGCGSDRTPTAIYIYKLNKEQKKLIKTLPISTITTFKEDKWGFIRDYWIKNYRQFK